jgi:hypothetical protein
MIKSAQIEALGEEPFHYLTALTKPQIEALLKTGLLQRGLFAESLAEVNTDDGVRYILRRNLQRAREMAACREEGSGPKWWVSKRRSTAASPSRRPCSIHFSAMVGMRVSPGSGI